MPPDRPGDAGPEATPGGPRPRPGPRGSSGRPAGGPKRPPRPDPEAANGSGNGPTRRARGASAVEKPAAKKASAKKTPAKKSSARKAPAKRSASKAAPAKKATTATPSSGVPDGAGGRRSEAAVTDARPRPTRSDPVTRSTGPLAGATVLPTDDTTEALRPAPVDFAPVPAPHVTGTGRSDAGPAPSPAPDAAAPASTPAAPAPRPGVRHGRRVKRVVRRIELWSVLKLCLVLYTCLYIAVLATLAVVWGIAYSSGQIENLQEFLGQVGLDNYRFYGDQMFRAAAAIGAIGVLAGTILTVLTAALVNLISEMTGGIRVVVIEEDVDPGRRTR